MDRVLRGEKGDMGRGGVRCLRLKKCSSRNAKRLMGRGILARRGSKSRDRSNSGVVALQTQASPVLQQKVQAPM